MLTCTRWLDRPVFYLSQEEGDIVVSNPAVAHSWQDFDAELDHLVHVHELGLVSASN